MRKFHARLPDPQKTLPCPGDIGLPEKFSGWRPWQEQAVHDGLLAYSTGTRAVAQALPTGSGKSPIYIALALLGGWRTCILTSTKGLQDQLLKDFAPVGLADIRGKNAYPCPLRGYTDRTCETGPCLGGLLRKKLGCPCRYQAAYEAACQARLVVTNYAYWVAIHRFGEGLGPFDLLVLDEAHATPDELAQAMTVELEERDLEAADLAAPPHVPNDGYLNATWHTWASSGHALVAVELERARASVREFGYSGPEDVRRLRLLQNLTAGLELLASAEGPWIVEEVRRGWQAAPLWPQQYAERYLFRGVPRVLLVSATVRQKTLELLGLPPEQFMLLDYPSTFPPARGPVYYVPTVRVDHRMTDEHWRWWLTRIDQIIRPRLDRKGIMHTVSFRRKDRVLAESEFARHMMANSSEQARTRETTAAATVERFKAKRPPAILVSPSLSTGYDFPYRECEWQIVGKIGFPDMQSRIMQARHQADPTYGQYLAAQELVQTCGRGMRAADDRCETIIIDDHVQWFLRKNREHIPAWFDEFYRRADVLPLPPPKLEDE